MALAPDGTQIPISIVYKKGIKKDGKNPLYLTGYGAYGVNYPASFSSTRLSLLEQGIVCAIAHIRGGSEMGRKWYEDGKFLHKRTPLQILFPVQNISFPKAGRQVIHLLFPAVALAVY